MSRLASEWLETKRFSHPGDEDLSPGTPVLGLWTSANEGAKFWPQVLTELRNRGVKDIFLACVDGLKGFPQAIETVFPKTTVQLCVAHMVRASLHYVGWKQRTEAAANLKTIYRAATEAEAEQRLNEFAAKWDGRYPSISALCGATGWASRRCASSRRRSAKSSTRPTPPRA